MADPETAREQRAARIQARLDKKMKAEEAKKAKAEAARLAKAAQAAQQKKTNSRSSRTPVAAAGVAGTAAPGNRPAPARGSSGKKKTKATSDNNEDEDEEAMPCLHPDDPANFLKLSKALRILLSRAITDSEIDEAFALLSDYCSELVTVSSLLVGVHLCTHSAFVLALRS